MDRLPTSRNWIAAACLLVPTLALLHACSTGGTEERPDSELKITASHHMFGFGGNVLIEKFPIPTDTVGTDRGTFNMTDGGDYTVARPNQNTANPENYSLSMDGSLYLVVPVLNSAPTRFVGAYRSGDAMAEVYYFTDRYAPTKDPVVGFYCGTRTTKTPADAKGEWHVFSQHVIFSSSNVPDRNDVGRSVSGRLTIQADANPNNPDVITGTGLESSNANITFTGTASGFDDNALDITLDYKRGTQSDSRVFRCGQSMDVILGVDEDETDGEIGMLAMVESFAADPTKLPGSFHFGAHTIFVAPTRAGIDAANGTIIFNDKGGWQLDGVGRKGPVEGKFSYSGSYAFENTGTPTAPVYTNRIVFTVSGTNETWTGAIDQSYGTLVLVDNELETRSGNASPELNLFLAVRKPAAE